MAERVFSNGKYSIRVEVLEQDTNQTNNTSTVIVTLYGKKDNGYRSWGTWEGTITIDGTSYNNLSGSADMPASGIYDKIVSVKKKNVNHGASGTKDINIAFSGSFPGTSDASGVVSGNFSYSLNQIKTFKTVTFNSNGGYFLRDLSRDIVEGTTFSFPACRAAKRNLTQETSNFLITANSGSNFKLSCQKNIVTTYVCDGWADLANAAEKKYSENETSSAITENKTYYAHYNQTEATYYFNNSLSNFPLLSEEEKNKQDGYIKTYKVTINPNHSLKIASNIFVQESKTYKFLGWGNSSGEVYPSNTLFTENTTIFPVWFEDMQTAKVILPELERNGYIFLGYSEKNSNVEDKDIILPGEYQVNKDIVYYGVWKKDNISHNSIFKIFFLNKPYFSWFLGKRKILKINK